MKTWNDITLFQYLQIDGIMNRKGISDLDKSLLCVCAIYGITEHQLDNAGLKKATKLSSNLAKIFSTQPVPQVKEKLGKFWMNYDISSITFGQYIEIAFFLGANPLANAHRVLASISTDLSRKNKMEDHGKKSECFMLMPIADVLGSLDQVKESFMTFNKQYHTLFGLDSEVHSGEAKFHPFNKRYGWVYSAAQVAEYERITLEQAYGLPVRQAFHDLCFLKAKAEYESFLVRMSSAKNNIR